MEIACSILKTKPDLDLISCGCYIYQDGSPRNIERYREAHFRYFDSRSNCVAYGYVADIARDGENMNYPGVIYRAVAHRKALPDEPAYGKICDIPFVYEQIKVGKVAHVEEPMFWYRIHAGSDTLNPATGCTLEQMLNLNSYFKRKMDASPLTKRIYNWTSARKLKAFSNLGKSKKDFLSLWRYGLTHGMIRLHSFLLVFEYVMLKHFLPKTRMPLHNWLWRLSRSLYQEFPVEL